MKIGIFGASGFSREVADICIAVGIEDIVYIEQKASLAEISSLGFRIVEEGHVVDLKKDGFKFIIGIGDNMIRKKVYLKFSNLTYINLIHPSATYGFKQINHLDNKYGNIITAGVRLTSNIIIGNFGIYNLNCTIGHDCTIEDFTNIGPGANISGNVILRDLSYVGTNASILQGSREKKVVVGINSVVGAGAVVTKSIPDNTTVKGIPAR